MATRRPPIPYPSHLEQPMANPPFPFTSGSPSRWHPEDVFRMRLLVALFSHPDYAFQLVYEQPHLFLRVGDPNGRDNGDPAKALPWWGRKWRLSPHMTDMEVVQTALKAILTAQEHEAREQFKVDGVAVCGPHLDLASLIGFLQGNPSAIQERTHHDHR